MSGIYISLCMLLCLLLIITQKVKINIFKDEYFRLEFHFLFFALHLKKRVREKKERLSFRFYSRLVKRISELARVSEIEVKEILLCQDGDDSVSSAFTKPYRYGIAASSILAHISSIARKFTLHDNAFVLLPDRDYPFGFSLTIHARLYNILKVLLPLVLDMINSKSRRKEKQNVGN